MFAKTCFQGLPSPKGEKALIIPAHDQRDFASAEAPYFAPMPYRAGGWREVRLSGDAVALTTKLGT